MSPGGGQSMARDQREENFPGKWQQLSSGWCRRGGGGQRRKGGEEQERTGGKDQKKEEYAPHTMLLSACFEFPEAKNAGRVCTT